MCIMCVVIFWRVPQEHVCPFYMYIYMFFFRIFKRIPTIVFFALVLLVQLESFTNNTFSVSYILYTFGKTGFLVAFFTFRSALLQAFTKNCRIWLVYGCATVGVRLCVCVYVFLPISNSCGYIDLSCLSSMTLMAFELFL